MTQVILYERFDLAAKGVFKESTPTRVLGDATSERLEEDDDYYKKKIEKQGLHSLLSATAKMFATTGFCV